MLFDARDPIGVGHGAGRHDQVVIGERVALGQLDAAFVEVETGDPVEAHACVVLGREDAAHREADVVAVEPCGGHLVEQRLERVVVPAVDDRHVDRGIRQRPGHCQAPEARSNHNDPVPVLCHVGPPRDRLRAMKSGLPPHPAT